jgi:hypothetical protein
MRRHQLVILFATASVSLATRSSAQQAGGMKGMAPGAMGMSHDSATMALMMTAHELMLNHDRIRRTVANLPNGIRTVTESDDPHVAALIKKHVGTIGNDVKVHTTTEATDKGVIVVQTSDDSASVVALQKHAAEVTELVDGGMAAMHASMMKNPDHAAMMKGADHEKMMMGAGHAMGASDSAFAAMQQRGQRAMGVDQYTSTHHFEALPDGGRIELQRDVDDSAGVLQIRTHLQEIAKAFAAGDFSTPAFVHMQDVPGTKVMAAKRAAITYSYHELPRGGEVRIQTTDAVALAAIHEFLAFQRKDHHAS